MARQNLNVFEAKRTGVAITKTNPSGGELSLTLSNGKEFVLVENGSTQAIGVLFYEREGYKSNTGHTDNEGADLPAGSSKIFGPFNNYSRWKQADGKLYFSLVDSLHSAVPLEAIPQEALVTCIRNPDNLGEAETL